MGNVGDYEMNAPDVIHRRTNADSV